MQRTTTNASMYWLRTGSSSSSKVSLQLCQSAQIDGDRARVLVVGRLRAASGNSSATAAGSVRYSMVSIWPL